MSEPIQDRRELDEGEKSNGKFFETGADATMAFDAAEEVFDFVPAPIVAPMERRRTTARTLWRDADACVLATQSRAKVVGVKAFVADDTPLPQATEQGFDGEEIVALALSQSECDGAPTTLDDGRQLLAGLHTLTHLHRALADAAVAAGAQLHIAQLVLRVLQLRLRGGLLGIG